MPNQRSKKKSFVGGYVPTKLANDIKSLAKQEGKDAIELMEELLNEFVEKRKRVRVKRSLRTIGEVNQADGREVQVQ